MALKNAKRDLTVETLLGQGKDDDHDDPLLLARVTGAEGISMPFAFELTMIGNEASVIEPEQLIGRPAGFGIRKTAIVNGEQEDGHYMRFGVFETFERLATLRGRRIFRGRFVPAFRMTAYEQRYRVFEDRTLLAILREVLEPFPLVDLRTNLLADLGDARIPFCVQYNETTFAFVHRLLDRFGIAYRFEHEDTSSAPKPGLRRERMVLSFRDHRPDHVDHTMPVLGGEGSDKAAPGALNGKSAFGVRSFRRAFNIAAQNARVGDFNIIDPQRPPGGLAVVRKAYAFSANRIGVRAEAFPASGLDPADPDNVARLRMRQNESNAASASGRAYDTSFRAGRIFFTDDDRTGSGAENQAFILRIVAIDAFDIVDDRSIGTRILDVIGGLIFGNNDGDDLLGTAAEQLRDRIKGEVDKGREIVNWLQAKQGTANPSGLPGFIADKIGRAGSGIFAGITAALPAVKEIGKIIDSLVNSGSGFACAFEAIPISAPLDPDHWPTPAAARPVAHGPHFALVVGPKGVRTDDQDIWTDALGRVRIRFPWDQGPPGATPDTPAEDGLATDRVTAWVRVSEGWAGTRFGSQFLPRIGQEVVVSFIDGDPEKPLVTGRVYNAGSGRTHLPFPSTAAAARALERTEDLRGTETSAATRSGIRTRSTPHGEGKPRFHLLRFEDKRGQEQLVLRAEHRLDTTSTGSRYDTTHGSRHTRIGGGKAGADGSSGGGDFISVGGEMDLTIGDARYTEVTTDDHLVINGNQVTGVGGGSALSATVIMQTADTISLEAKHRIQLVVGGAMLVITPAGVFTNGAILDHQGASAQDMALPEISLPLGAAGADPGDPADWLARQPKGGSGGGRRSYPLPTHKGMQVRAGGPSGTLIAGGESGGGGVLIDAGEPPDAAFVDRTVRDLQDLRDDPETADELEEAEHRKHPVVIADGDLTTVQQGPHSQPADPRGATTKGKPTGRLDENGDPELGTGTGTPTIVDLGVDQGENDEESTERRRNIAKTLEDAESDDTGTGPGAPAPPAERRDPDLIPTPALPPAPRPVPQPYLPDPWVD
ncbi:type VI secretion system Vgr family protein [Plastoroseomonas arctica]|uniref:Gp5/Type VI secretion system Vgr protein OB-fold domain-containing protein n=1 Tax=Plastoroseomonas arctica TaxID=1509237 RepID=A0AAF1KRM4_9PROT|nr:contractile injection system protein, VgrG/Pvc8 family [Plastoroseomonas arctica]MBR0654537.1 hypothetical protein [Plastoroseomonas arctica]